MFAGTKDARSKIPDADKADREENGFEQMTSQVRIVRSGNPEQGAEAFLLKVPVVGEGDGQSFLAHGLHRDAIRKAVSLIRTRVVER